MMDEKKTAKKQKIIDKSIKILNTKKGEKICTFFELAKALKISQKTFRFYELNTMPEIKALLEKHRHEKNKKVSEKNTSKICPKKGKKVSKKTERKQGEKVQKNEEEIIGKSSEVFTEEKVSKNLRSYEEIKAKLFIYKAWKQKKYETLKPEQKIIIDRQIALLEWVLQI